MVVPRVFVSFDFDHDAELKNALVGQSGMENVPFEFSDGSLKEPVRGNWKAEAGERIGRSDMVWVICGKHTDTATGVSAEVRIARKQGKPVYFIEGRENGNCKMPRAALPKDPMLDWTWENLAAILGQDSLGTAVESTHSDSWSDRLAMGAVVVSGLFVAKRLLDSLKESPRRSYGPTTPSIHRWY